VSRHQRYDAVVVAHRVSGHVDGCAGHSAPLPRLAAARFLPEEVRLRLSAASLRSALNELEPDIVHAHFGDDGTVAERALRGTTVPLVVSFYGYDATELPARRGWRKRLADLFARASAVLAEGPHLARRLIQLGANPGIVRVHRIPLHLELFPFRVPEAPVAGDPMVILQACRFVEKKGVDTTIAAFARADADIPNAQLWLLGYGPQEAALRDLARASGAGDRIRFLAARDHAEYAAVLRAAHIFVHPSRTSAAGDGEGGAPTAILEAQATGLPLVSTTHADIPFVTSSSALLNEPGDVEGIAAALVQLANNPREWESRARAGRAWVEDEHNPTVLAGRLEQIYDEVRFSVPNAMSSRHMSAGIA
jgi:colanic acid/amylovoran biosynthesis glycosyltransferase